MSGTTRTRMGQSWGSQGTRYDKLRSSLTYWLHEAYQTATRSSSASLRHVEDMVGEERGVMAEAKAWVDRLQDAWEVMGGGGGKTKEARGKKEKLAVTQGGDGGGDGDGDGRAGITTISPETGAAVMVNTTTTDTAAATHTITNKTTGRGDVGAAAGVLPPVAVEKEQENRAVEDHFGMEGTRTAGADEVGVTEPRV